MKDTDLYSAILGISLPWKVVTVDLDVEGASVFVNLDFDTDTSFVCPTCGKPATLYDRRGSRRWRHLDSCQFQTYLVASLPRVNCSEHGVLTASVFWAEPNSRFTLLFEQFAIHVLQATQVQSRTAELLRLSPSQVHDLMQRAVGRGLSRRSATERIEHLSIDEKSFKQGHRYVSVLSDPVGKRVLDIAEGRTQEAVEKLFLKGISFEQSQTIRSVSMDMWRAFMNARDRMFPEADTVHDRYHVAAYLNDAVDKTRRQENRTLNRNDDTRLNKTKYLWLRSEEKMTPQQKLDLEALTGLELETAKVWSFKESFRNFFSCATVNEANLFLETWYAAAVALGNVHLSKIAKMLIAHKDGLLAYIRHRVSNASAESLNAQIQRIKANAKGYRKWGNFRIAILFFLGKLDLNPHKSP